MFVPPFTLRRLMPGRRAPALLLCASLLLAPAAVLARPRLPQGASPNQAISWRHYDYDRPDDFVEVNLPEIENRLRETPAVGVLTKLSLKHQLADLLHCFGRFHDGEPDVSVAELRARFEALFDRLCSLLRRRDYVLYRDVVACEEQVWATLIDPSSFRLLMGEQRSDG